MSIDLAVPCGLLLNELISNACKLPRRCWRRDHGNSAQWAAGQLYSPCTRHRSGDSQRSGSEYEQVAGLAVGAVPDPADSWRVRAR
jgi:hypothetical protein